MKDRAADITEDTPHTDSFLAAPDPKAAIVDAWFLEHIQCPPISQNTECYNQALAAKEKLKALLAIQ